jgi:hypothetical protein
MFITPNTIKMGAHHSRKQHRSRSGGSTDCEKSYTDAESCNNDDNCKWNHRRKKCYAEGLSLGVVVVVAVPVVVLPVADINGVKCTNKRFRDPVIIYYL